MLTNHPLADLFPLLTDATFKALVADIRENGLREPIILHEGRILDGRNRYRACTEVGIEPITKAWDQRGTALAFVVSKNLHRRHLDESQRAMVTAKIANMKHGSNQHISQKMEDRPIGPSSNEEAVVSLKEAAKMMNVSERSAKRARAVRTNGVQELQQAVEAGAVSVAAAAEIAQAPAEEQREIMSGGEKKVAAAAKSRRAARKKLRRLHSEAPTETEHDRDLRLIQNIWSGVCVTARQEFLRSIATEIEAALTAANATDEGYHGNRSTAQRIA